MGSMRIKVYHLLFLLLLFLFAIPARGQESEKTNQKLQTEIEALREHAASLQVQLMEWTTKVSASAKQLEVLTRSITMRDVRMLRETVDSLEQKHLLMEDSIQAFDVQIRKAKDTIQALEGKLEGMKVYSDTLNKAQKQRQMQELLAQNNEYLNLLFSKMSMERLMSMKDSLHEFDGQEGDAQYKEHLAFAMKYKPVYDLAWGCVADGEKLDSIGWLRNNFFKKILSLPLKDKMSKEQFQEMDSMDIKLSRIYSGINKLKEIVKTFNSYRNQSDWDKDKTIAYYRTRLEEDTEYQKFVEVIPFLKDLWNEYWEELEEDPLKVSTITEEKINKL